MRLIVSILLLISFISLKAQTPLPLSMANPAQWAPFTHYNLLSDGNNFNNKWHLSKYAGISTSFGFFNGSNVGVLSVPIGLQLNRRLNNNLYAFAGISTAPAFFNLNQSFKDPGFNKTYPGSIMSNANSINMYSRAEMGLMYINDQKTFSISGSIGIDRYSSPVYPSNRTNTKTQQPAYRSRQ